VSETVALERYGVALPAWVLRLVMAVASAGIIVVVAMDGAPPALLVVGGLLAASGVLSPSSAAPAVLSAGAAALSAVYAGDAVLRPTLFALVFLVHLLHVSGGLAAVIPRGARVHVAALRAPARRFVTIQAVTLAVAGLAVVLPAGQNPVTLEVLAVLVVAATAALAILLLRRR